ncbi:uncharacterized protein [Amphiura filiformis]|uniref:uncharacterized protein isoform X2 n=1 Tax=Amphiura filiformis TaxID=82378 RepID=UPI003B226C65
MWLSYVNSKFSLVAMLLMSVVKVKMVESYVCMLQKRPDPSRDGALRWSLPYAQICLCQGVVAPKVMSTCPKVNTGDLRFVDDPLPLTMRHNWRKDILDALLDRTTYCSIRAVSEVPDDVTSHTSDDSSSNPSTAVSGVPEDVTSQTSDDSSTINPKTIKDVVSTLDDGSTHESSSVDSMTSAMLQHSTVDSPAIACNDPLGMENRDIPDGNIQASSSLYPAKAGRLNGASRWGTHRSDAAIPPWIQADIGYATDVFGVITQGSGDVVAQLWTTSFKVSTFLSTLLNDEMFITDQHGAAVIFPGNVDISSEVIATFPEPVDARIVRITCLDGSSSVYASLRFEILGCKN